MCVLGAGALKKQAVKSKDQLRWMQAAQPVFRARMPDRASLKKRRWIEMSGIGKREAWPHGLFRAAASPERKEIRP